MPSKRLALLLLAITLPAWSQAPACPSFYAAGATYSPAAAISNFNAFYAVATPITKCGSPFQAYSLTLNALTPSGSGKNLSFTNTTTTGAAIPVRQIGRIGIFAYGNVGVASATATKLGTDWGGFLTIPLPRWSLLAMPTAQNVNGKWIFGAAIGRSW